MENSYQKIVNVAYLAFSALVAFILLTMLMRLSNSYDLESKIKSIEFVIRGLSLFIGAGLFFGLYRSATVNAFMNEVAIELMTKVSWPTSKETVSATIVVIVTVVIAGFILGLFDSLWVYMLRWFL